MSMLTSSLQQYDADNKKSANVLVIEELLKKLDEKREYKMMPFNFEDFLKDSRKWPYFSNEEIPVLYDGISNKKDESYYNGLVYHTGNVHNNQLGVQKCLEFLAKLFTYDFYLQCEEYIEVFRQCEIDGILLMELETHLVNKGIAGQSSLIIMKSYIHKR